MFALLIVIALGLTATSLGVYWTIHRQRQSKNLARSLSMVVLKIHPPPLSADIKSENRDVRSVLEENIAQATTLYNLLAATAERETVKVKYYKQQHLGFEIVASHDAVHLYAVVPLHSVSIVRQALVSAYKGVQIEEVDDHNLFPRDVSLDNVTGGYLNLREHYAYPLATYLELKVDVMKVVLEALANLGANNSVGLQILLRPAPRNWQKKAQAVAKKLRQNKDDDSFVKDLFLSAVRTPTDKPESKPEAPNQLNQKLVEAIEKKVMQVGFEVIVRLVVVASNAGQGQVVYRNLLSAFHLLNAPKSNGFEAFIPKKKMQFINDFNLRSFPAEERGNILSIDELTTLFHLPNQENIPTSQLKRLDIKEVDGPRNFLDQGLLLGHNTFRNQKRAVILGDEDRFKHMYIVGQTGVGKSVFLENLALQDIQAGRGFAFVDPHGETAEKLLNLIPNERLEDVIYFNPGNLDFPMGLNIFEHETVDQQDLLIQEAILMLYKLYDPQRQGMMGARYEYMFRNAAKLIMADPAGGTFIDIPKLFNDRAFVNQKLQHVKDQPIIDFWTREMVDAARSTESGDIKAWFISKFSAFLTNTMMRNIIGQTKSVFQLRDVMDEGKIMIVNLSQGLVGEMNMKLLGMFFVTKFQMAAMGRADIPESQRRDFTLYVDEFQNFATDSFATILSAARKYRLALVVANQHMTQLSEEVRDSVYGNVSTAVSFRLNAQDAEHMVKQFYHQNFEVDDLTRLPLGQTLVRTLVNGAPTSPFNMATLPPSPPNRQRQREVEAHLIKKYAKPRKVVEAEIAQRLASRPPPALRDAESLLKDLRQKAGRPAPGLFTEKWLKQKDSLKQKESLNPKESLRQSVQEQKKRFEKELLRQKELEKSLQRNADEIDSLKKSQSSPMPPPLPPMPPPLPPPTPPMPPPPPPVKAPSQPPAERKQDQAEDNNSSS